MPALPSDLRNLLEKSVIAARAAAEAAAHAALTALAVERDEAFPGMTEEQRRLRVALRARARQLGDGNMQQGIAPLVEEVAYEQWHRMLFARFLAENTLLMHPSGVPVTLADCAELAAEEGEADPWLLAARYASGMLPGIFRLDDPSAQVRLAPEGRIALERILADLPSAVFTADDALGWVYQFWQTKAKKEVNEAVKGGRKVGAEELPAVTQLFTEDYMVRFLLENSLGAWWAARHSNSPLLKEYAYLRYRDDGTPAAGTFPGWPERAAAVTVMDPCCGSGHFVVAAFEMLRRMRMEEEGLGEAEAADAVIRDNLFGLEIDPRCTQIAAFALALAAWKAGGYRTLPLPNLACSGIPVAGQLEEWKQLADGDVALEWTLERLYHLFRDAPTLGSLINPADVPLKDRMFAPDFSQVAPLLERALTQDRSAGDPVAVVFGRAVEGVVRAAEFLMRPDYTLVATNPPYLGQVKQSQALRLFCQAHFPAAKLDLATVFLQRLRYWCMDGRAYASVVPLNWLFQSRDKELRLELLTSQKWELVAVLGADAFETGINKQVMLSIFTNSSPGTDHVLTALDAGKAPTPAAKAGSLQTSALVRFTQASFLRNPTYQISISRTNDATTPSLSEYTTVFRGLSTGETTRFTRYFWEIEHISEGWERLHSVALASQPYMGRSTVILWQNEQGEIYQLAQSLRHLNHAIQSWRRGKPLWSKLGITVNRVGYPHRTLYTGDRFSEDVGVVVPRNPNHLAAMWAFFISPEFVPLLRTINPKLDVEPRYLDRLPFDLAYWQKVADEAGPLPEPYSNDPTQWLFQGDPTDATVPLQVAVARLLGYRWPQQEGSDRFDALAIKGGIACLPAVAGEAPAAERLRALLAAAYDAEWSPARQEKLLAAVGYAGRTLDDWLRDACFPQHCALFHNRPFIWHVWDGRRDGFSALVNYHTFDAAALNRLIYTYLGAWIAAQQAERDAGVAGADGRLVAALELKKRLEAIRDGEPPYDIYVRWKPLDKQPLGWEPDLNDGVRLNVRPFVTAAVLRSRFTINWNKDRGKNPDGSERVNDLHFTRAQKEAARAAVTVHPRKDEHVTD